MNSGFSQIGEQRRPQRAFAVAHASEHVDVVITDMLMPETDGVELIRALRDMSPKTKILAMSGGGSVPTRLCLDLARGFGADLVRTKPLRKNDLLRDVATLVGSAHEDGEAVPSAV